MNNPYALKAYQGKTRDEVALEYAPVVRQIANKLAARLPANLDREDLVQAGMIGLLDALEKFDPGREAQFRTYAEFRIKGAMLDDLRATDWVPRSVRENADRVGRANKELSYELGRAPFEEEIAVRLGLSLNEYRELLLKSKAVNLLSIEDLGHRDSDGDHGDIHDVLADPQAGDPLETLSLSDMKKRLAQAIRELPDREQLLLSLYYDEGLNLKEIGEVMNITESRVSQLRTQAIMRLRNAIGDTLPDGQLTELLEKRAV
ncbi:MAG: FliA/WhiG family RNA polymerase sigma factor [Deltaproteobacteria bacterium]|nr:FliA/WhiG family RNA polymerase sigma factor [Deltaproteobacteria bacterium]